VGLAGLVVLVRLRRHVVGLLLVLTSVVWFAGSLAAAGISRVHEVGLALQFLHRGVLLHCGAGGCHPVGPGSGGIPADAALRGDCRPVRLCGERCAADRGRAVPTLLVGATVAGTVVLRARREQDPARRVAWWSTAAGLLLWVGAATVLRWVPDPSGSVRVVAYDAGIVVCAVAVSRAVLPRVALPDRALQYTDGSVSSVEEALGLALGDHQLRVGFSDAGVFRAGTGTEVRRATGQVCTVIDVGAQGKVLLTHREGLLDDRRIRAEVVGFARVLAEQHRLRERLAAQTAAVRASRHRLRVSEDRATSGLGTQIEIQIATIVRELRRQLSGLTEPVPDAEKLADDVLAQLTLTAESLHPTSSPDRGIAATSQALEAQSPIPVDLQSPNSTFQMMWGGPCRLWRRKQWRTPRNTPPAPCWRSVGGR